MDLADGREGLRKGKRLPRVVGELEVRGAFQRGQGLPSRGTPVAWLSGLEMSFIKSSVDIEVSLF